MNETVETLLSHRTIRKFENKPVPEDLMHTLFEVAMRTATSRATQNASIIRVKDQAKRQRLAEIGDQPYQAKAPEYLVFIADCARAAAVLQDLGHDPATAGSLDYFREGFTYAVLMCQSVASAAESLGLGTTMLGSILNQPAETIAVLNLPQYTFPVLGLVLGYPNQSPELKPRIPQDLRVMTDTYQAPVSWTDALAPYDQEMHRYYDLRSTNQREDTFTNQIVKKMGEFSHKDSLLTAALAAQGFHLG